MTSKLKIDITNPIRYHIKGKTPNIPSLESIKEGDWVVLFT
jgi:hypothetical protein